MRKRAHRGFVHERQEAIELRCDHSGLNHLKERRKLSVILGGLIERCLDAPHGVIGKGKLAARVYPDARIVANGLTC